MSNVSAHTFGLPNSFHWIIWQMTWAQQRQIKIVSPPQVLKVIQSYLLKNEKYCIMTIRHDCKKKKIIKRLVLRNTSLQQNGIYSAAIFMGSCAPRFSFTPTTLFHLYISVSISDIKTNILHTNIIMPCLSALGTQIYTGTYNTKYTHTHTHTQTHTHKEVRPLAFLYTWKTFTYV